MQVFCKYPQGAETMIEETLPHPLLPLHIAPCYTHPAFHGTLLYNTEMKQ